MNIKDEMTEQREDSALVGGLVDESSVTLGVYGDDLDPEAITKALGCQPTASHRKGDPRDEGRRLLPPWALGAWLLTIHGTTPEGPEELTRELLTKLTLDTGVWENLSSRFGIQLRIAAHFTGWNKGFDLTSDTIAAIGRIHAKVVFDLYGDDEQGTQRRQGERAPPGIR